MAATSEVYHIENPSRFKNKKKPLLMIRSGFFTLLFVGYLLSLVHDGMLAKCFVVKLYAVLNDGIRF